MPRKRSDFLRAMSLFVLVTPTMHCVKSASAGGAQLSASINQGIYDVTGRTTMGQSDRNQCGIQYTGSERVGTPPMLITGIDSRNFGSFSDGVTTPICGQIVEADLNGTVVQFVIVDRIWENTSDNQLDVAHEVFYSETMKKNNVRTDKVTLTGKTHTGLTCDEWVLQDKYYNAYCKQKTSTAAPAPASSGTDASVDSLDGGNGSVGGYSCEDQKKWGKCGQPWMSPVCDAVCGVWSNTKVASAGGYSCEDQKKWGKCGQTWMSPACDAVCNGASDQSSVASGTPAAAPAAVSANIVVKSSWQGGYCADLVVVNRSAQQISSWIVTLNKNGDAITQSWNLQVKDDGDRITVSPVASWNGSIAAGQSNSTQGFCASSADGSVSMTVPSVAY